MLKAVISTLANAEARFEDAMRILPRCSPSLFQPMELFPLFPGVTALWADQLPHKQYWGLHPPLPPLDSLLANEAQQQSRTLLEQEALQSIAEYLLEVSALQNPLDQYCIELPLRSVVWHAVVTKTHTASVCRVYAFALAI